MRPALPILAGLCAFSLPASADPLLETARSISKEGPDYRFEIAYDDGAQRFVLKVDQARPEDQRVVSIAPDPSGLEGDAAKRAQRLKTETRGDIWCSNCAANIPVSARRVSDTPTSATYSFTPLPGEDGEMRDIVKHLTGTATIEKASGQILAYELTAPKAFKPAVVAKVDRFSMKVACRAAPDGRTHIDTFALDLAGSAMMKPFSQSERRTISNLAPAASSGYGAP